MVKMLKTNIKPIDNLVGGTIATKRITGRKLQSSRQRIMIRDEYTCKKCGTVTAHGEVDHVVPLHLGGCESDDNRQWLCVKCHSKKSEGEGKQRN